jgi:hypothetical protein
LIGSFGTLLDEYLIKLPPGTKVISAPRPVAEDSEFGSFSVEVEERGTNVEVRSRLTLKVTRVAPARYDEWKQFCARVDQAFRPRLVIGK